MPVLKFPHPFRRLVFPAIIGISLGALAFAFVGNAGPLPFAEESAGSEQASGADSRGIRVRVIDGDTIEDRDTGERIRLENIDTPETGDRAQCRAEREAGAAAARAAREIVAGGAVTVRRTGRTDQYGLTIGFVLVDGRDLGVTLMERGLARPWRGRREAWCAADGSLLC